jgi:L-asparaginase
MRIPYLKRTTGRPGSGSGRKTVATLLCLAAALMAGGPELATADTPPAKPSVAVIGVGGTIAGVAESRVGFQTYAGGRLSAADLVEYLQPEVGAIADVRASDFRRSDATGYRLGFYYDLSKLIDEQLEQVDAVVVATATQTMEELAYWLDLTVRSPKPVVVTGSMRTWNVISSDGPANLYNAVMLAASDRTRCFGSVVMLNDEIFAARDATKTSTLRLDSYQAWEVGVLGAIDEKRIRLPHAPARVQSCGDARWRTPFDLSKVARDRLPRTEIVYAYADAGGEAITGFADSGVRGIVVAGDPSVPQFQAAQSAIRQQIVFVAANRNGSGAVYDSGVPGVVAAEDLLPQKARLLLTLSLAMSDDLGQIKAWFSEYGAPQFIPWR